MASALLVVVSLETGNSFKVFGLPSMVAFGFFWSFEVWEAFVVSAPLEVWEVEV